METIAVELMGKDKDLNREKTTPSPCPTTEAAEDPRAGGQPMEDKAEAQGPQSEGAEGEPSLRGRGGQCSQKTLPRLLRIP